MRLSANRSRTHIAISLVLFVAPSTVGGEDHQVFPGEGGTASRSTPDKAYVVTLVQRDRDRTSSGGLFSLEGSHLEKADSTLIFSDGFETGGTLEWSSTVPQPAPVPSGAVMFFSAHQCPSGWSPLLTARGRGVVGVPTGGTLGGLQGSALSDGLYPLHSHSVSESFSTEQAVLHNHGWSQLVGLNWTSYTEDYRVTTLITWQNGIGSEGSGVFPFAASLGPQGQDFNTSLQDDHAHLIQLDDVTAATPAALPYLQLLACQKD